MSIHRIFAVGLIVLGGATVMALQAGSRCAIDPDRYAALRLGQTYDQVVAILGCPGDLQTASNPRPDVRRYAWSGQGIAAPQLSALFQGGVMVSRSINSVTPITVAQTF